ncbi:MAG: site-2 protease family protein [Candidatus Woesearchaeota archaeon]|jgi:membrane-associated protease RseP (regulator of RpoE activity)
MNLFGLTITWTLDVTLFVVFVVLLSTILLIKRKDLVLQKIIHPFLYIIMYRTTWGLTLMDRISTKYRAIVKFFGYLSIGIGFAGMLYISLSVLSFVVKLIFQPTTDASGVSFVLPFTHVPGIGYLSFTHWILAIFILAIVHEFSHGVVARAHNVPVKSSGFAVFGVFIPLIPAAFVEPDEKKLSKMSDIVQYSVFAAGPMANIVLAFLLVLAFPYVGDMTNSTLAPFEETITSPAGFSYEILDDYPAEKAGMPDGIITSVNNKQIEDYTDFYNSAACLAPGDEVTLGTNDGVYTFSTAASPDNPEKGFMGIKPTQNEREINPEYASIAPFYYWFRGFIKWLFLLNFFIGLANLLPLGIVDGGRMLQTALHTMFDDKLQAKKIWGIISLLFLGGLLFALAVNYLGNPFTFLFG